MTNILKAKPLAKQIYENIKTEVASLGFLPKLCVLIIGNDPAAEYYVASVAKRSKKLGIETEILKFPEDILDSEFFAKIEELNNDKNVHGIMVQKPLPKHISEVKLSDLICSSKDVDGFNPVNLGKLMLGRQTFIPCTAEAVIEMMKFYEIETQGKEVLVIGRSDIVGKPLANLLLLKSKQGNATVTVAHSRTKNLIEVTQRADIVIAAIGKAKFVKKQMLKKGAIVIDVGVNKITDNEGKEVYVGDVDYDDCFEKTTAITPVPGGVGTITTAMLLSNVLKAAKIILK